MSEKKVINLEDFSIENIHNPDYTPVDTTTTPTPPSVDTPVETIVEQPVKKEKTVNEKPKVEAPTDPGTDDEDEEVASEGIGQTDSPDEVPDLRPFYNLFHQELGWDIPEEDMPENSIQGMLSYMNDLVEKNSVPKYSNEVVADFDKFVANGGDPAKFLTTMYGEKDYSKIDLESDFDKRQILDDFLAKQFPDKDASWREKKIDRWDTTGVLDDEAADAKEELVAMQTKEKAELVKRQEAEQQRQIQEYQERIVTIEKTINTKKDFAGIPVSEKDKKPFFEFMTKVEKDGTTKYHKAIQEEDSALAMAYLAFKGFNVKNLATGVKTEVVNELKKSLSKFSSSSHDLANKTAIPAQSNKIDYKQFDLGH